MRTSGKILCVVGFSLILSATASADVIVLKSGRRIETWKAEERDDRVYYQTPEGEVGIPKRLVDRIERNDSVPSWAGGGSSGARQLPTPELPAAGDPDVAVVVTKGEVDRTRLSQLDAEAQRLGTSAARERAAAAHDVVGHYLFERGDVRGAGEEFRRALSFTPNEPALLLDLAVTEMTDQRYASALERIEVALRQPRYRFEAYRLQGWIYYQMEDMNRALAAWKRALAERRDPELEGMVQQAEREERAAESFKQQGSGRFTVRYDTGEAPGRVAYTIVAALDDMYGEMASTFNYQPRESIVVLLYSEESFYDLTGMPPEVHGLYDGKIRMPVRGLTSLSPQVRTVLRHELVHAFVWHKTHNRAPRWLQEGLAQWHAGQRPPVPLGEFRPLFERRDGSGLLRVQYMLQGNTSGEFFAGYMASWVVVDYLMQRYSGGDVLRFLDALARGDSEAEALRSAFRLTYEDLDRELFDSLR